MPPAQAAIKVTEIKPLNLHLLSVSPSAVPDDQRRAFAILREAGIELTIPHVDRKLAHSIVDSMEPTAEPDLTDLAPPHRLYLVEWEGRRTLRDAQIPGISFGSATSGVVWNSAKKPVGLYQHIVVSDGPRETQQKMFIEIRQDPSGSVA